MITGDIDCAMSYRHMPLFSLVKTGIYFTP